MDLGDLTGSIMVQLEKAMNLKSKPSWLCFAQITMRFDEGDENLVKKAGKHKVLD